MENVANSERAPAQMTEKTAAEYSELKRTNADLELAQAICKGTFASSSEN